MIRPGLTGTQADALAALIVSLRPGQRRWTKAAVYDALTDAAGKFTPDAETLIRAAVRAALTGSNVTPEVISMRGAHWEHVDDTPVPDGPRATRCARCHDWHLPDAPCSDPASPDVSLHALSAKQAIRKLKRYEPPDRTVERARKHTDVNPPGGETE